MTRFKFKPIYVAVFLCALAVVALWQPYWHSEALKTPIVQTTTFKSEEEALNKIYEVNPYYNYYKFEHTYECEYGSVLVDHYFSVWKDGSIYEYFDWIGVLYKVENITVYDELNLIGGSDSGGLPKLFYAGLFLAVVSGAVLLDAQRKQEEEP